MKLTILQMLEAKRGLDALAQKGSMSGVTALKVARMINKLVPEVQALDVAQQKLFEQYGEVQEYEIKKECLAEFEAALRGLYETYGEKKKDGQRSIKAEHMAVFQSNMTALLTEEIDVVIGKLPEGDLKDVRYEGLAADLQRIEQFIEEANSGPK